MLVRVDVVNLEDLVLDVVCADLDQPIAERVLWCDKEEAVEEVPDLFTLLSVAEDIKQNDNCDRGHRDYDVQAEDGHVGNARVRE